MNFEEFKQFYQLHPDADNNLFYDHFPFAPHNTIRSYKSRCSKMRIHNKESVAAPSRGPLSPSNVSIESSAQDAPPEKGDPSIDENWFEMEDPELTRHTYRSIILNSKSTIRERLEASRCLDNLSKNVGKLDLETQTDKEVKAQLAKHSVSTLVSKLKRSSQEEF